MIHNDSHDSPVIRAFVVTTDGSASKLRLVLYFCTEIRNKEEVQNVVLVAVQWVRRQSCPFLL